MMFKNVNGQNGMLKIFPIQRRGRSSVADSRMIADGQIVVAQGNVRKTDPFLGLASRGTTAGTCRGATEGGRRLASGS